MTKPSGIVSLILAVLAVAGIGWNGWEQHRQAEQAERQSCIASAAATNAVAATNLKLLVGQTDRNSDSDALNVIVKFSRTAGDRIDDCG
jgi:lipopolysaccharide export system protein LptC